MTAMDFFRRALAHSDTLCMLKADYPIVWQQAEEDARCSNPTPRSIALLREHRADLAEALAKIDRLLVEVQDAS